MDTLNLPITDLKVVTKDGKAQVFDPLRRRYVALTPEEWVRQQFVGFLVRDKGYPASCIGNEVSITLNGTRKRCDTVVYDGNAQPALIVEYKAPQVEITQQVFEQISRYNISLRVKWLIVSNGLQTIVCHLDKETGTYEFLPEVPEYDGLRA